MNRLLALLDPYRWLIAGVMALSLFGGFMWYRHSLIQEGIEREKAKVAQAVAEQKALAEAQTRNMKEVADEAQAQYVKDMATARADADRFRADLERMRGKAASSDRMARATKEAISQYASEAERDIDFCSDNLVRTGEAARTASAAAWALNDAWPSFEEVITKQKGSK